jgi:hypothetical protein
MEGDKVNMSKVAFVRVLRREGSWPLDLTSGNGQVSKARLRVEFAPMTETPLTKVSTALFRIG